MSLDLKLLPDQLAICRMPARGNLPSWAMSGGLRSVTWTKHEMSIVCAEADVPEDIHSERGWRALKIIGLLDFELTGILLEIARPLAEAGIPIFVLSTFDTDYVLVKDATVALAMDSLAKAGHRVYADKQ